jgi:hypothetical protein
VLAKLRENCLVTRTLAAAAAANSVLLPSWQALQMQQKPHIESVMA